MSHDALSTPLDPFSKDRLTRAESVSSAASSNHIATNPQRPAGRFKIMGHLVIAVKRFQNALNPSYTFGKRMPDATQAPPVTSPASTGLVPPTYNRSHSTGRAATGPLDGRAALSQRTTSGRTASGRPTVAGIQHGFKGNMLFKPLPQLTA